MDLTAIIFNLNQERNVEYTYIRPRRTTPTIFSGYPLFLLMDLIAFLVEKGVGSSTDNLFFK
jgi:hypothetical protein